MKQSNFSNNNTKGTITTPFKKHYPYEAATSLSDAKHIADDYSNVHKYQHRASVTVVGNSDIRPYDPIYLDGLPNGMSGYWTVLSVVHVFGGRPTNYLLKLEVGTDIIGEVNSSAQYTSGARDIQGDLSGQSLAIADVSLTEYSDSPNASSLEPDYGLTQTTANNVVSPSAVPSAESLKATPFKDKAPNLSNVKKKVQWSAKSSSRVVK